MTTRRDVPLDQFFEKVRGWHLGEQPRFGLSLSDLGSILNDDWLRSQFTQRFKKEIQNPELRQFLTFFLRGWAGRIDEASEKLGIDADGIDRSVGGVGIGVTGAGIAAIFATGVTGAFILTASGLFALTISGIRARRLRKRAVELKTLAIRIREMLEALDND